MFAREYYAGRRCLPTKKPHSANCGVFILCRSSLLVLSFFLSSASPLLLRVFVWSCQKVSERKMMYVFLGQLEIWFFQKRFRIARMLVQLYLYLSDHLTTVLIVSVPARSRGWSQSEEAGHGGQHWRLGHVDLATNVPGMEPLLLDSLQARHNVKCKPGRQCLNFSGLGGINWLTESRLWFLSISDKTWSAPSIK